MLEKRRVTFEELYIPCVLKTSFVPIKPNPIYPFGLGSAILLMREGAIYSSNLYG